MTEPLPYDVLIVEDHYEIGDITRRILTRMGLTPRWAQDGQQAITLLDERRPDLLLLDLNLPEVDGWHVLEYAKKKYGTPLMKVVVMTANDDSANRLVGKLQTVDRYLVKPVERETLTRVVSEMLGLG